MNMWSGKGHRITASKLLPPELLEGVLPGKGEVYKTKEDWEENKKEITKMARWHSRVLKDIKAGKKTSIPVAVSYTHLTLPTILLV